MLLEAVCGAGKTELVYAAIADQLKRGNKVGFAISRRQVVLEIAERLRGVFSHLKVVAVCQGHTDELTGDLIVCTTHQLYRYRHYFDLLIIDEPDAFPFKGNLTLQGFAANACRGVCVYLTATPDQKLRFQVMTGRIGYLYLAKRPSGKDLCVPQVIYGPRFLLLAYGAIRLKRLLDLHKPVIIFTPTIALGRRLCRFLKLLVPCCNIDSTVENRDELIADFRAGRYKLCVSTTVLERGITIASVNIIVLYAHSDRFDEASLTQMAGRVGRSVADPHGECFFLARRRSENIDRCLASIRRANASQ
ncbi:MAG: helicase [Erysipelotrichaceae bacterium]|nr:helicase [Erysipelotrichaceae bacterium]